MVNTITNVLLNDILLPSKFEVFVSQTIAKHALTHVQDDLGEAVISSLQHLSLGCQFGETEYMDNNIEKINETYTRYEHEINLIIKTYCNVSDLPNTTDIYLCTPENRQWAVTEAFGIIASNLLDNFEINKTTKNTTLNSLQKN